MLAVFALGILVQVFPIETAKYLFRGADIGDDEVAVDGSSVPREDIG